MADVNNKIKEMCTRHNYTFIDHKNINGSCLNRSNLHLNAKGAALLAVDFINFLRGGKPSATYSRNRQYQNFQMEGTVRQLENILRTNEASVPYIYLMEYYLNEVFINPMQTSKCFI